MPATTRSPHAMDGRARVGAGSLLCLLLTGLALLATLVFAGNAHALVSETPGAPGTAAAAEEPQQVAPVTPPAEETQAATGAPTPPAEEQPTGSTVTPPAEEAPPVTPPPPAEEAPPVSPPPAVEEPPVVVTAPPPPEEEPVPVLATIPPSAEESQLATSSSGPAAEPPKASVTTQAGNPPGNPPEPTASDGTVLAPTTPIIAPTLGEAPEAAVAAAIAQASGEALAARRARQSACELFLGPCGSGSLTPQTVISTPAVTFGSVAATAPWRPGVASSPGHGEGDSVGGGRPVTPAPAAPPSGASGSGAPAGGSGAAPSIFLTLAGLLLLAGPRATRRLRLLCRPWLTAFFVLIPERPG